MSQFPSNIPNIDAVVDRAVDRLIESLDRRERDRLDQTGSNGQSRDIDIRDMRNDLEQIRNSVDLIAAAVTKLVQDQSGGA